MFLSNVGDKSTNAWHAINSYTEFRYIIRNDISKLVLNLTATRLTFTNIITRQHLLNKTFRCHITHWKINNRNVLYNASQSKVQECEDYEEYTWEKFSVFKHHSRLSKLGAARAIKTWNWEMWGKKSTMNTCLMN